MSNDPTILGYKGQQIHDAGYIYTPYIPMFNTSSIPMSGYVGDNDFYIYMFVDSKKETVEKLDKNLADGWAPEAVVTAGRINDITNHDVYAHGTDELCGAFGFTREEYETQLEEIKKKSAEERTRKLKARWSIEAAEDLKHMHGINMEEALTDILAAEIANEIDAEIVDQIKKTVDKINP